MVGLHKAAAVVCVTASVLFSGFSVGKAAAVDFLDGKIMMHVYGDTAYSRNDKNRFTDNDRAPGQWSTEGALNFTAKLRDDTTVVTQIFGNKDLIMLDLAFVDFTLNENLKLRGGYFRTPMGLYNETRDIKYLHVSVLDPYLYQNDSTLIAEQVQGAGAYYKRDIGEGSLEFSLYGGDSYHPADDDASPDYKELMGGQLVYATPIEGLRVLGSAQTSKTTRNNVEGRNTTLIGSLDYVNNNINLKSEYAHQDLQNTKKQAYYVQAGYTFFDKLTPFVRYDYIALNKDKKSDPSFYQESFALGADYKINQYFAFRAEDHIISGYGLQVVNGDVAAGTGSKNWNMFAASINYMF